ncbi:ATP-dependent helicase [Escherichia coli]|nr:ATP-dependent helicase [Escherichia coli]
MPVWMMPPGCVMPSALRLPESLPEIYLHRVSYPLRDLFLRYLRAHALVTAEQLAHEFSLGIAIVEEQLQQLREQGLVMNLQQDIWVSDEVFRRLRLRSLQAAREATRPVAGHDLCAIAAGTSGRITRHRW